MSYKIVFGALVLAAISLPQTAYAQTDSQQPAIVVTAKNQKDWNKGNALEAKGLVTLQKANVELVRYSADIVTAQENRNSAQARAENARMSFENLTARPFFSDPVEARKWAKQVDSSATEWERNIKRGEKAQGELDKAQKRQETAQKNVAKAQQQVDEGRALMARAERDSLIQN